MRISADLCIHHTGQPIWPENESISRERAIIFKKKKYVCIYIYNIHVCMYVHLYIPLYKWNKKRKRTSATVEQLSILPFIFFFFPRKFSTLCGHNFAVNGVCVQYENWHWSKLYQCFIIEFLPGSVLLCMNP